MFKIVETPTFQRQAKKILTQSEKIELFKHIAVEPYESIVIRSSGGIRKKRIKKINTGKSGGYRAIYFINENENKVYMLAIFDKKKIENIPTHILKQIKEKIDD